MDFEKIIPKTISTEAQKVLETLLEDFDPHTTYPAPDEIDRWQRIQSELELAKEPLINKVIQDFDAKLVEKEIDQLKYIEVYPKGYIENGKTLIYLHGGGYVFYTAKSSLTGSIPLADYSKTKVVVLDYPLAPQANFEVILQSFVDLYAHLLEEGIAANDIAIYGDSAGGGLTAGGLLKLKEEGYPMPASVVLWSPWSDLSAIGDSYISLVDHDPKLQLKNRLIPCALAYAPKEEFQNPFISPIYGNYDDSFPPTMIQIGTREIFLSDAVRLFQKMEEQGVDVTFDPYEGMWHAWQKEYTIHEAQKAVQKTWNFINDHWE